MDYRLEQLRFELREDPSSRIFFKLGEHLRRAGELDEAIEVLRTGLQQHGRYIAAWVSLGRAQLDNGDADGAHQSLERALQLDPENAVAARAMGEAAILKGDWVTAVKALKRARGLAPQDDALDERIEFVEARLAELGLLKKPGAGTVDQEIAPEVVPEAPAEASEAAEPAKPAEPAEPAESAEGPPDAGDEPFAVKTGDTGQWDDSDDVFAAGWVEEKPGFEGETTDEEGDASAPGASAEAAAAPGAFAEPPPLTDDDLASMVDADDSPESPGPSEPAVLVHQEEVPPEPEEPAFSAPEPEPVSGPEPAPVPEPPPEVAAEPEPEPESELETAFMPAVEPEAAPEPVSQPEPEPVPEHPPELEAEPEPESEAETAFLPALEPEAEAVSFPEPEPEPEAVPEAPSENVGEPEPLPESWPDPESDAGPELEKDADGVPLPTMTLARLAIDQGDLDLAERTLRGVLEREPGHAEAADLLATVVAGPPDGDATKGTTELSDSRAEALQRWLDAVRLASERLKT